MAHIGLSPQYVAQIRQLGQINHDENSINIKKE
jgi:hypothetical protein